MSSSSEIPTPPPQQTTHTSTHTEKESPRVARISHQKAREQVVQDLGPSIPKVSFQWFKAAVLPDVEDTKLAEVYDVLKEDQELSDEGWTGLEFEKLKRKGEGAQSGVGQADKGQETPALDAVQEEQAQAKSTAQTPTHDGTFYKPLTGKFNKVLERTKEVTGKSPLITFCSTPTKVSKSEGDNEGYKADINALLLTTMVVGDEAGKANHECDIVVTGELKKLVNDKVRNDNVSMLVGKVNHLMGSDPTRRFAYGLTIEHTDTRFWFFSRSHIFVTEKLDLQKNIKDVIYFVMALGSATCNAELGFDPTVRRVQESLGRNGKPETRYRFKVNGYEYETVEPISVYKAKFLLGRANRVFRVRRVENGVLVGPTLVLKDLWLPEGAKTELEVQQDIKDNINKVHIVEGLDPADFEKYFVTIEHCEIVKVPSMTEACNSDDNSTNFLRGSVLPSAKKHFCLKFSTSDYKRPPSHVSGSQMSTPKSSVLSGHRAQTREMLRLAREHYGNKAHHRILMEDAGKPLEDIRELRTILLCIGQASTGLSIMFSAGMVHRDISTGNLLVSEVDGELRCKITDLEYAKKVGESSQSPQDVKTGTPLFMALEIDTGYYHFKPQFPSNENQIDVTVDDAIESVFADLDLKRRPPENIVAVEHVQFNFLHDVESLLWILMYFLLFMHPEDDQITKDDADRRLYKFEGIFVNSAMATARHMFLHGNAKVEMEIVETVPEPFKLLLACVMFLAKLLRGEYVRVEALPDSARNRYSAQLYTRLRAFVDRVLMSEKAGRLGRMETVRAQSTIGEKRRGEAVTDGLSTKERKRSGRG
ncbi:hypothetical protein Moror_9949 [Moniliophthora roreri MCA 2997]|uniref:Protein kinase domain-containing protein n=1 Tax=Moniliophthora roreri (strain MCA 2997) TaxID=1381753 RepID=V2WYR5_MONRO|nr:hypothetical protein Moror_9949 [Moniliophthora roreri MCA 2997]